MRVYLQLPDSLLSALQAQARAAHRPPRYHLEWLIEQVLQAHARDAQPGYPVPNVLRPTHAKQRRRAGAETHVHTGTDAG